MSDTFPAGAPCWIELSSSDVDASRAFYGDLLGWTSDEPGPEYGGYVNFHCNGAMVAGCMPKHEGDATPDAWLTYLASDDVKATADEAAAHGAQVVVAPMDVMDLGTMAVLLDPGGAGIGVWRGGTHKGFAGVGEVGAPTWFELLTRDYDKSVAFYRDVFAWDAHTVGDTPEFRYTTLGSDDDALAGIMDASAFLAEGEPAHWRVYFEVDDTDAALEKAVSLGGVAVRQAEDTPYGRIAKATDPTGAGFLLRRRPVG